MMSIAKQYPIVHQRNRYCRHLPEKCASECHLLAEYPEHVRSLISYDKNKCNVLCTRCNCIVLRACVAKFVVKDMILPAMVHTRSSNTSTSNTEQDPAVMFPQEPFQDFWFVEDMLEFENVGFSNPVENIKYLVCADCEQGPIGFHELNTKKAFYVALNRVKHASSVS